MQWVTDGTNADPPTFRQGRCTVVRARQVPLPAVRVQSSLGADFSDKYHVSPSLFRCCVLHRQVTLPGVA